MINSFSVVIATYNRIHLLKNLLNNIQETLKNLNYEIIISDNASTDGTKQYFESLNNKKIKYYRNHTNLGFFKNFLNGLKKANNEIVWVCSDDDDIGSREFFIQGLKSINENNADLVFGRLLKREESKSNPEPIDRFPFKKEYTKKEYLNNWLEIRERISSACFLYKKDLMIQAHEKFLTMDFFGGTMDYAIHYYIINNSNRIHFINEVSYIWTISQLEQSVSGESRKDLMWQMMNIFAFPLAYFSKDKDYDIEFFNKYINYGTQALISSQFTANNDTYFIEVTRWIRENNFKEIYIFGKGEVGIMLNNYLKQQNINITSYIDDNMYSEDCLTYHNFLENDSHEEKAIILATYKSEIERKLMKKLINKPATKAKTISLYELAIEEN